MKTKLLASITKRFLLPAATCLLAACAFHEPQVVDRTDPNRDSVVQVNEGFDTFGRKWGEMDTTQKVVETPKPAAPPATPPPAPRHGLETALRSHHHWAR